MEEFEKAAVAYLSALEELSLERTPHEWAATQTSLGIILQMLGERTGDAATLLRAETAYREAVRMFESSSAEDDLQGAARDLARMLVHQRRYDDAAAVIEPALSRSDKALIDAARSRDGAKRSVERVGELYGLLSLCRLRQSAPDVAAALLTAEGGRARLLADALAFDALRLEDLDHPDAYREISDARDRRASLLHRLGRLGQLGPKPDDPEVVATDISSVEARESLLAELRDVTDAYVALCRRHGLIHSPDPLRIEDILAAVPAGGALVLPVVTEIAAFAFVLVDGASLPEVIDLPALRRDELARLLSGRDGWLGAYHECFREGLASSATHPQKADHWRERLTTTLAWLWKDMVGPIHRHLRDVRALALDASVVILPPGLLGLLPIHAAGPDADGRHFCDHWTVSYAPSVRTLLTCKKKGASSRGLPPKLLAIVDPFTDLPGSRHEAALLKRIFAFAAPELVILEGADATLAKVLTHLVAATHIHASTHGWFEPGQPMRSGLHLADIDQPLILETLREIRLKAARLAFLAACESGLTDTRLPEEFIGLPVGFVQAGAACVIAALWPIRDDAAFLIVRKFYEFYLGAAGEELQEPAAALHAALKWLRHVTFHMLAQEYPAETGANGLELRLGWANRFTLVEPRTPRHPQQPSVISLPLGDGDARPYGAAEHWAAFTVTGA